MVHTLIVISGQNQMYSLQSMFAVPTANFLSIIGMLRFPVVLVFRRDKIN